MIYLELKGDNCYRVVIKINKKVIGEVERGDDGFYYYWPSHELYGRCYSAELLAELADKLNKLNEVNQKQINDYFQNQTLPADRLPDSK